MKVLFIAEMASPHAGRWINLAAEQSIDSAVFQATCAATVLCNELRNYKGTLYSARPIDGVWSQRSMADSAAKIDAIVQESGIYPAQYVDFLLATIAEFKPDLIHVLGLCVNFHNSSRVLLNASQKSGGKLPPIVYSSWGADLDYYARVVPAERPNIIEFLKICEFHITECRRDVRLASELGFSGVTLDTLPANGGIEMVAAGELLALRSCDRDVILIKGRDEADGDPIGRAMKVLDALELAHASLKSFKIKILQASHGTNVRKRATELQSKHGLDIEILPFLSEEELYRLIKRSYLFIANTVNDGLPLSLVEAMAFGAYPIHSDLESIRDYVISAKNGTLVEWSDVAAIANAICEAISRPDQVAMGRELNFKLVQSRLTRKVVGRRMVWSYFRVAGLRAEILRQKNLLYKVLTKKSAFVRTGTYQIARTTFRLIPEDQRKLIKGAVSRMFGR